MLDPEYLLRVSEGAEDIAEQLHNVIIKEVVERIMIRLGRGDEYVLTPRDKWQLEVLEDAGYILSDLQAEIAKKTKMQRSEIREAFEDADVKNRSYDDAIYTAAGLPKSRRSPAMVRTMQRMFEATLGEWSNYCQTTANAAQRLFIRECDKAYNLVLSGTMGYTEAVKRAVETIAGDGVVITYPSGKTDTIETATLRAVRTGVSQTAAQITLQRAQENGVDLVVTSSHLGARPTHEPWQGKVFHVDYDTAIHDKLRKRDSPVPTPKTTSDKYPDFVQSTRYGYVDGLCGANCRHSFYPYIEGVSHNPFEQFDSEENKKRYEAEQQQRALERAIRKSKRKCEGLKTAVDNADEATRPAMQEAYGKAAAKLRQQNAEYKQFCEDNGLKTRQDRVSIAGWNRKQAAQARAVENELKRQNRLDKQINIEYNNSQFRSTGDPLADAMGSAEQSHPEEVTRFVLEIEDAGATLIREEHEKLAYSPGMLPGMPGVVYVSKGASYGAWLHEMRHLRDDRSAGWSGMRILASSDERYKREVNAYNEEIAVAEAIGRKDIAERLRENLEEERRLIYGIR